MRLASVARNVDDRDMETLRLSEVRALIEKELADHPNQVHSVRYDTLVGVETRLLRERFWGSRVNSSRP
jgi:hypothetical protein